MDERKFVLKSTDRLLFKFALIFFIFTIVVLILCGIATYRAQMKEYKAQCIANVRSIGDYMERLIQEKGEEFIDYQNYYMEHYADVLIPYNFNNYRGAWRDYERALLEAENSGTYRGGSGFKSTSETVRKAYFKYYHEYWLLTFENARKAFNLPYTYYLVPKEDTFHMIYMIDGERTCRGRDGKKADSGDFLYLGDEYYNDPEVYKVQWSTWFTGERQNDLQVWNNEWGYTYAYYTPLTINGMKLGLIGTEIEVEEVNKDILSTSLRLSAAISIMLVSCLIILLLFINKHYIKKLSRLSDHMMEFSTEKNFEIASRILSSTKGKNEITLLSYRFSELIQELSEYMNSLLATVKELKDTKQRADEMNTLANKDSLTGIRNKNAYDREVLRLEFELAKGCKKFGIAMIDLNFLKVINDTYGHEHGNSAIKQLCYVVCHVFKHSPVFRVGGDEFVVVLEKDDYINSKALVDEFNSRLEKLAEDESLDPWECVSAAIGYALYDEAVDKSVDDVFSRADKNMYARKKEMKAVRTS
ncbi:MAG: diguanylate cyclase [Treponemataceae bacterium]|nr:diguanylate cyclase [Treponemataceae bacterium]